MISSDSTRSKAAALCGRAFRHRGVGMLAGGYRACPLRTRFNVSRKLTLSTTLRAEIVPPILAIYVFATKSPWPRLPWTPVSGCSETPYSKILSMSASGMGAPALWMATVAVVSEVSSVRVIGVPGRR
jgi:hypothetical protein